MRALLAVILGSGLVAACGGGGGGSTPAPAPSLLAINSTNQDAVGRSTATAGTTLVGVTGGVSANPADAAVTPAAIAQGPFSSLARHIASVVKDPSGGRRSALTAGGPQPQAIDPSTVQCSVSGSFTLSFGDADNNGIPSLGDTMTMAFNACTEVAGETITGNMVIGLSRIDLVNQLLSFAGSMSVQQFTIVQGTRTSVLNGSIGMTYTERSPIETQFILIVGADGFSTRVSGSRYSDTVTYEPNFSMNQVETFGTTTFTTVTLGGAFSASAIGGRLLLENPVPMLQFAGEAYPRAGTLRVVGNGSALRMQALNASTIRFELDANLDGNYEASKDLPWSDLLPA